MINKTIVILPVIAIILGMMTATLTIPVKAVPMSSLLISRNR